MLWTQNDYTVDTDRQRLDRDVIFRYLHEEAYWSRGIPRERVERSIEGSLCFGLYGPTGQVGFARVITDYATFAYLADVFVLPEARGNGLSVWLMSCICDHPELQGLRRWLLATRDAHSLYAKFGFAPLGNPDIMMERHATDVYSRA